MDTRIAMKKHVLSHNVMRRLWHRDTYDISRYTGHDR